MVEAVTPEGWPNGDGASIPLVDMDTSDFCCEIIETSDFCCEKGFAAAEGWPKGFEAAVVEGCPNGLDAAAGADGPPKGFALLWAGCPKGLDVAVDGPAPATLAKGLAALPPPKGLGFCPKLVGWPKAEPPPSFAKALKPPPPAPGCVA